MSFAPLPPYHSPRMFCHPHLIPHPHAPLLFLPNPLLLHSLFLSSFLSFPLPPPLCSTYPFAPTSLLQPPLPRPMCSTVPPPLHPRTYFHPPLPPPHCSIPSRPHHNPRNVYTGTIFFPCRTRRGSS